jgi:hypothetical protein
MKELIASCVAAIPPKVAKKSHLQSFFSHLLLVLLEIRDAYLVDCFSLDAKVMLSLVYVMLNKIDNYYDLKYAEKRLVLVVFPLGDIAIVGITHLMTKYEYLKNRHLIQNIIIVNVTHDNVSLSAQMEIDALEEQLTNVCHDIVDQITCNSNDAIPCYTIENSTTISNVFLGGWLLGYISVYNESANILCINGLSMIELKKITIFATFNEENTVSTRIPFVEFTIPTTIFHNSGMTEVIFEDLLSRKLNCMQTIASMYSIVLTINDNIVTYPSLTF